MKAFISLIIVAALVIAGYFVYKSTYGPKNQDETIESTTLISTNMITISNSAYSPSAISIKSGETIEIVNSDNVDHTVTSDSGSFDIQVSSGGTNTLTISAPGTYPYHCTLHPFIRGTIVVL